MIQITAEMVKELREKTGAGMMDCKKALAEAGNMEDAVRYLREKGLAAAAKKAGRTAAEGLVGIWANGNVAALVEVNCETDFVARNQDFSTLVNDLTEQAAKTEIFSAEDLLKQPYIRDNTKTVEAIINDKIATIGEKITVRRLARYQGGALYGTYLHAGGSIGVMVELGVSPSGQAVDGMQSLARDLAMHTAAAAPRFLKRQDVDAQTIATEREIFTTQVREQGKPENILPRIVDGKIEKFYTEVCLLEQPFVKDPDVSIEKLLKRASQENGCTISLNRFTRFKVGEGLEKKSDDFAQEVAKMVG